LLYVQIFLKGKLCMKASLLVITSSTILALGGCTIGSTSPSQLCPINAPLFDQNVAQASLIKWGTNALAYSPYATGSTCPQCTDKYIGAAYFAAIEYLPNAVLLPTVSPITRTNSQQIYNYFTNFLGNGPQANFAAESSAPIITYAACGYGEVSGYYNFNFASGAESAAARYTYAFRYLATNQNIAITVESGPESGTVVNYTQTPGWYIQLHNSAKLPIADEHSSLTY
jgi:hypothetical protein